MVQLSPTAVIRETPMESFVHVRDLPGSAAAARQAASRAAKDGFLTQIRRGLYYRGKQTRYGTTTPLPKDVAREVLNPRGTGPAEYSAARAWGLTTQIPTDWHVATLHAVEPIPGVVQHSRKNLDRIDLNEMEIALLELLRAPDIYVEEGWPALFARFQKAVAAHEIDLDRLRAVVPGEYNRAVRDNFAKLTEVSTTSA